MGVRVSLGVEDGVRVAVVVRVAVWVGVLDWVGVSEAVGVLVGGRGVLVMVGRMTKRVAVAVGCRSPSWARLTPTRNSPTQ